MKLDKTYASQVLESEYINGTATLGYLAQKLGVSFQRLSVLGRSLFPNWEDAAKKRHGRPKKTSTFCCCDENSIR